MHDDVGAELDRTGQNRRGDGVVDRNPGPHPMRDLHCMGNVGHCPQGVGRRLQPQQVTARFNGAGQGRRIVQIGESHLQSGRTGNVDQPLAQAPIHDPGRDDTAAGRQCLKHRDRRCHARSMEDCIRAFLQPRQQLFNLIEIDVMVTDIGPPRRIAVVGVTLEGGRRLDRGHESTGRRLHPTQCLGGQGFRLVVVAVAHWMSPSWAGPVSLGRTI